MSICTINDVSGLSSSNQPRFARTSEGVLYLAYVTTNASGGTRVYVRSSSDGGQNWSAATMVSADYTSSCCALVSDSRDDLHVGYVGLGEIQDNPLFGNREIGDCPEYLADLLKGGQGIYKHAACYVDVGA